MYSRKLLTLDKQHFLTNGELDHKTATDLLFTKYLHWRYENEVRAFTELDTLDPDKKMYFKDFSDDLRLVQVIVGAESALTKAAIKEALGEPASTVEIFKARLAFKTFRVVRQRNQKLWA